MAKTERRERLPGIQPPAPWPQPDDPGIKQLNEKLRKEWPRVRAEVSLGWFDGRLFGWDDGLIVRVRSDLFCRGGTYKLESCDLELQAKFLRLLPKLRRAVFAAAEKRARDEAAVAEVVRREVKGE